MTKKTNNRPSDQNAEKKDPPVEVKRIGTCKGNIWANEGKHGTNYTVTVERIYYDQANGEWRSTRTLDVDGLLTMAKVLDWCHTWIVRKQAEESAERRAQKDH